MTSWATQRREISATRAKTVAAFCLVLAATLAAVALLEVFFGTTRIGVIVLLVAAVLIATHFSVKRGGVSPRSGAIVLAVILLVGVLALIVGSAGRAIGVLIFTPVLIATFVLLLNGWERRIAIAITVLVVPLAAWLQRLDLAYAITPDPAWVDGAIFRVTAGASVATLLIGMSYRRVMIHYRRASMLALDNWREEALVGQMAADRLSEFADVCADVLWETDRQLRFVYFSDGFAGLFGVQPSAVLGMTPAEAHQKYSGYDMDVASWMAPLEREEAVDRSTLFWKVGADRILRIEYSARPFQGPGGEFLGYRGVMNDVTEEHAARRALEYEARHDQMTGLANRESFLASVGSTLESSAAGAEAVSLAFIDLDDFKAVNDVAGHEFGDDFLVRIADILRRLVRDHDAVAARIGGDEFALCAAKLEGDQLAGLCRRFLGELSDLQVMVRGQTLRVSASIGVHAEVPVETTDPSAWLSRADERSYAVKQRGGADVSQSS